MASMGSLGFVALLMVAALLPTTAFVPPSLMVTGVVRMRFAQAPRRAVQMSLKNETAPDSKAAATPPFGASSSGPRMDSKQQIAALNEIVKNQLGSTAWIEVVSNLKAKAGGAGADVSIVVKGTEEPVTRKQRKAVGENVMHALSGSDLQVRSTSISLRTGDVSFEVLFPDAAVEGGTDPNEGDTGKKSRRAAVNGQPAALNAVSAITKAYAAQYSSAPLSSKGAESMVQTALSRLRGAGCEQPGTMEIFRQVMEDANKGRLPPSMVSKERGMMMKLGGYVMDRDDEEVLEILGD